MLLRQLPWLQRLAAALCSDPAASDDLVQGACAAAIEHPPRDLGALRSWLGRVMTNLHRQRARGERARQVRELAQARDESQPSAAAVVARAEAGRSLVAAVLGLAKPYRSTILLRYFEDLSPGQIARQQGVPGSTVRTRLARGLAQLRQRLSPGDRSALAVLLVPCLGTGSSLLGVITLNTLAKVGIAVALTAALVWSTWPGAEPVPPAAVPAGSVPVSAVPAAAESQQRTEIAEAKPPDVSHAGPIAAPVSEEPSLAEIEALMTDVGPGLLEGVVLRGRKRVAGVLVFCRRSWNPLPVPPSADVLTASTDADGVFRFTGLESDRYRVGVEGLGGVHAETMTQVLTTGRSQRVVLLLGSARIEGHVYDAEGRTVAGAWVGASLDTMRMKTRLGFDTGRRTDAHGAFVLDALPAGVYWLYARLDGDNASGVQPDSMQQLPGLRVGETRTVDIGDPRRAAVWSGTVRARSGAPVTGPAMIALDEATAGTHQEAEYDAAGRFRIALRPGTWHVRVATRANWNERHEVPSVTVAQTDLEHDVILPGTRLSGSLVEQGTDRPWTRRPWVGVSIHREGHDYPAAFRRIDVGPDGSFVFDAIAPGTWLVETRFFNVRDNARHELGSGNATAFRVHVQAGDLDLPVRIAVTPPQVQPR